MGALALLRGGDAKSPVRNYFASLLNAVASLVLTLLIPTILTLARDIASEHAPGLTAVAGGMLESLFSLYGGIFFLVFFSVFYLARHSSKAGLRICLFWIPASVLTALGFAVWAWAALLMRLAQRS